MFWFSGFGFGSSSAWGHFSAARGLGFDLRLIEVLGFMVSGFGFRGSGCRVFVFGTWFRYP